MAKTFEALEKTKKKIKREEYGSDLGFSHLPVDAQNQFEKLKSNIILEKTDQKSRSILFASYNPMEGTSTIAANFAASLAMEEKYNILFIDANTRSPAVNRNPNIGTTIKTMTFSDMISQRDEMPFLPEVTGNHNLCYIKPGKITSNPSKTFNHSYFKLFINKTKQHFDFIIFDSSPIGKYYDSILIAKHLDGVILVVQSERTTLFELRRAQQMLTDKNIPILGVVLNRRKFYIPTKIYYRFIK